MPEHAELEDALEGLDLIRDASRAMARAMRAEAREAEMRRRLAQVEAEGLRRAADDLDLLPNYRHRRSWCAGWLRARAEALDAAGGA